MGKDITIIFEEIGVNDFLKGITDSGFLSNKKLKFLWGKARLDEDLNYARTFFYRAPSVAVSVMRFLSDFLDSYENYTENLR